MGGDLLGFAPPTAGDVGSDARLGGELFDESE